MNFISSKFRFDFFYLSVIFLWACFQFYLVTIKSFSGDEASTLKILSGFSLEQIIFRDYLGDFNPPLYFVLLKILFYFSDNEFYLRFINVILGILTSYFYLKTNSFLSYKWFIIVLVLSPVFSFVFFFLRPYALLFFFISLSWYLYNLKNQNNIFYFYFLFFNLLGVFTSYLFFFWLLYIFLYTIIFNRSNWLLTLTIFSCVIIGILLLKNVLFLDLQSVFSIKQVFNYNIIEIFFYNFSGLVLSEFGLFLKDWPLLFIFILFILFLYNLSKIYLILKNKIVLFNLSFLFFYVSLISFSGVPRAQYAFLFFPIYLILLNFIFQYKIKSIFVFVIGLQCFSLFIWASNLTKFYSSPVFGIDYREQINLIDKDIPLFVYPEYNVSIFKYYANDSLSVNSVSSLKNFNNCSKYYVHFENFVLSDELPFLEEALSKDFTVSQISTFKDFNLSIGKEYNFSNLVLIEK